MKAEIYDFLPGHYETGRAVRFCIDGNDPPVRAQVFQVRSQTDGCFLGQALALHSENNGLCIVRAIQVASLCIPHRRHHVPAIF